jgi:hypothetical protein
MRKHKYLWTAVLAIAFIAIAGLVHARGGLVGSHLPANTASSTSAPDNCGGCPLQWLMNYCCGGN